MKSINKIERKIKDFCLKNKSAIKTTSELDKRIINNALPAYEQLLKTQSAHTQPNIWRIIMQSKITKLAAAVCIVFSILIGIEIFYDTTDQKVDTGYQTKGLNVKLSEVRQMAAIGDVKGLVSMISEGLFESKLVSANFLANIGQIPTIETLPMHASGDLILDSFNGNIRLRSTKSEDWLEMIDRKLIVHSESDISEAGQVRLTHDINYDSEDWERRQRESDNLRLQQTELEKELAELSEQATEDTNELRERLAEFKKFRDMIDNAVYISIENGLLKLEEPTYERTAYASFHDGLVRTEWHGHILESNSITLSHRLAPVRTDGPPQPIPGWRERFDAVYSLDEGEIIRWIHTPYIPERQIYATQELHYYSSTDNPPPPGYLSFFWDDGDLHNWMLAMSELSLDTVLWNIGLERYEYRDETPDEILSLQISGDWVIRNNASIDDKMLALEKVLQDGLDPSIKFEKRKMNCDVIVVRGQFKHVPLENAGSPNTIYGPFNGGSSRSNPEEIIKKFGGFFNRPIVFETEDLSDIIIGYDSGSYLSTNLNSKTDEQVQEMLDSAIASLASQTSLSFEYDQRDVDIWFITKQDN